MSHRDHPTIIHVDMDAFFVAVERLDRPELRGRPVVVGGDGPRGVVAAASYEARAFGIHSAMPSSQARRRCPHAVFVAGRHDRYAEVSGRVMGIFADVTPLVEPLSLDEAFLDVEGSERRMGPAPAIAEHLRRRVLVEEGLTCSAGVATTKFVAKLASQAAKPRASESGPLPGAGVRVVPGDETLEFLHPLPVSALWGVGPATLTRMERLGVTSVGDLARLDVEVVVAALGRAQGRHLHDLANGRDPRPVVPARRPKSVGHEQTYARDLHRRADVARELTGLSDAVAARLRRHRLAGRTVTLKVRFGDFRTITRSVTSTAPLDEGPAVLRSVRELLEEVDTSQGVRLLGVSVSGLTEGGVRQLTLDDADGRQGWAGASRTVDEIRERFGADAIGPAATVGTDGLDVKGRHRRQWGPAADDPI
ncbi:MAG: DNA polymerase IV [Acidimicrobiales bacterium]|nr:DNA polymerase IV [Acidimicrobiales bacterium]